jgi:hypothetical protein
VVAFFGGIWFRPCRRWRSRKFHTETLLEKQKHLSGDMTNEIWLEMPDAAEGEDKSAYFGLQPVLVGLGPESVDDSFEVYKDDI